MTLAAAQIGIAMVSKEKAPKKKNAMDKYFPSALPHGKALVGCLPVRLFRIMTALALVYRKLAEPKYECVDCFCGEGAVSHAFINRGYDVASHDICLTPDDDILSPHGFVRHLLSVMQLAAGGICFLGPVCSSWVTINRSTSGRTKERPMGRRTLKYIRDVNLMISRVYLHRRFAKLLKTRQHHRICTWLGMYGSKTPKPIRLWSNSLFVEKLKRKLVRSKFNGGKRLADTYYNADGKKCFKGNKRLKASSAYPPAFGREVLRQWGLHARVDQIEEGKVDYTCDSWNDAKLHEVEKYVAELIEKHRKPK